ncbi:MAG: hypothetical protein HOV81_23885 [Kofleriaceae bacterium]|nr:hypothetical protein [Kofleriaceae bacterium]
MTRALPCALALIGLAACGDNLDNATTPQGSSIDATCSEADLPDQLAKLHGMTATETPCGSFVATPARCFSLTFEQPIDHAAPAGPTFDQRLFLVHRGCDRPMVIADWGYSNDLFYDDELSTLFHANSLWVEHRYQGSSVPAPQDWDWSALTIENGASDLHHVIGILKSVYGGRWVSTGASKGGITATYHAFFFKGELDGTIPYVAPASRSRVDPNYQTYLATHMTSPCAQRLRDAQVAALTTRNAAMQSRLVALSIPSTVAPLYVEYMVRFSDWGFWQRWGKDYCDLVPTTASSDDSFFGFFRNLNNFPAQAPAIDERSDGALAYEWLSEQGFAQQIGAHISDLLTETWAMEDDFKDQYPGVALPAYDGSVTRSVRRWAQLRAENLLLIYGELDPWSGGALDEPTHPTSARFFVPGGSHGSQLVALAPADRDAALAHAERMFGEPADMAMARQAAEAGARRDEMLMRASAGTLQRMLMPR